jgi:hypothetical protein
LSTFQKVHPVHEHRGDVRHHRRRALRGRLRPRQGNGARQRHGHGQPAGVLDLAGACSCPTGNGFHPTGVGYPPAQTPPLARGVCVRLLSSGVPRATASTPPVWGTRQPRHLPSREVCASACCPPVVARRSSVSPHRTAMGQFANRYIRDFGWEIAHGAVTRRPPISLYTMVPRTGSYAYDVGVWDSSIVQGPFSVAPCPSPTLRFASLSSLNTAACPVPSQATVLC